MTNSKNNKAKAESLIVLGVDIKTNEAIPDSDFELTVNIMEKSHSPDGEIVMIVVPKKAHDFVKKIEKFNISRPDTMILRSGSRVLLIEDLMPETLERYKLGKKIYLAIIDERKKIIARYEIPA